MLYKMKLKRKLILLIAITSVSFKSFSQTDTKILLTEPIARLVAKDLVTFDGLLLEYNVSKQRILALENKTVTLQEVINNLQKQLDNRNILIQQKDSQIAVYSNMTTDLKKALKKEQRTKKLYKIGSTIGLALIASELLLK
jgi:cell shape-determining protein MreC